jgi:hypothetical protein
LKFQKSKCRNFDEIRQNNFVGILILSKVKKEPDPVVTSLSAFIRSRIASAADSGTTVARLFQTFPAKVAGNFEKILQPNKCRAKQLF